MEPVNAVFTKKEVEEMLVELGCKPGTKKFYQEKRRLFALAPTPTKKVLWYSYKPDHDSYTPDSETPISQIA